MLVDQFPSIYRFPDYLIGKGCWETLQIPEEAKLLWIYLYGAGGNGGNGFTRAAGNPGGGGGGGQGGGISGLILPLDKWMTRSLHVWLPAENPSSNTTAWLSFIPDLTTISGYGILSAAKGGNGNNGSSGSFGSAGTGATAMGSTDCPYQNLGWTFRDNAGGVANGGSQAGAVGGSTAITTTVNSPSFIFGAPGGAGTTSADFAGGALTATTEEYPSIPGGPAGSNNGNDGIFKFTDTFPLFSLPGTGGGSSNTGIGGNGGKGAPGCGGAGGGAGTTGGTGGIGGPSFAMYGWS